MSVCVKVCESVYESVGPHSRSVHVAGLETGSILS